MNPLRLVLVLCLTGVGLVNATVRAEETLGQSVHKLKLAIEDLMETHGSVYPEGMQYLKRLDAMLPSLTSKRGQARDTLELYDLQADPDETVNLIHDPKNKALVSRMEDRLYQMLGEEGGMFIPLNQPRGNPSNLRYRARHGDHDAACACNHIVSGKTAKNIHWLLQSKHVYFRSDIFKPSMHRSICAAGLWVSVSYSTLP